MFNKYVSAAILLAVLLLVPLAPASASGWERDRATRHFRCIDVPLELVIVIAHHSKGSRQ